MVGEEEVRAELEPGPEETLGSGHKREDLIEEPRSPGAEPSVGETAYLAFAHACNRVLAMCEIVKSTETTHRVEETDSKYTFSEDAREPFQRVARRFHLEILKAVGAWWRCASFLEVTPSRLPCFDLAPFRGIEVAIRIFDLSTRQDPSSRIWRHKDTNKIVKWLANSPGRRPQVLELELTRIVRLPGLHGIEGFALFWRELLVALEPVWDGFVLRELRWDPIPLGAERKPPGAKATHEELSRVLGSREPEIHCEPPLTAESDDVDREVYVRRLLDQVTLKGQEARLFLAVADQAPRHVRWDDIVASWVQAGFVAVTKGASLERTGRRVRDRLGRDFSGYWKQDGTGALWQGRPPTRT